MAFVYGPTSTCRYFALPSFCGLNSGDGHATEQSLNFVARISALVDVKKYGVDSKYVTTV